MRHMSFFSLAGCLPATFAPGSIRIEPACRHHRAFRRRPDLAAPFVVANFLDRGTPRPPSPCFAPLLWLTPSPTVTERGFAMYNY